MQMGEDGCNYVFDGGVVGVYLFIGGQFFIGNYKVGFEFGWECVFVVCCVYCVEILCQYVFYVVFMFDDIVVDVVCQFEIIWCVDID